MKTVLITGGTGLVGSSLTKILVEKNYNVIILSRNKKTSSNNKIKFAQWNIENQTIDNWAIEEADFIVHLAGASVSEKRWTEKRKKEIVESRTKSSSLIVGALNNISNNVKAVISASAIGWYGIDTEHSLINGFVESDDADDNFLGSTCKLWEESVQPVVELNKRLVILRMGVVLSNRAGAYVEFIKSLKFKVAAILGNGKQIISWIHIDDVCDIFIKAIEDESLKGTYNCVAPNPVSNKYFMNQLGKIYLNDFFIPLYIPSFLIKLMLGDFSIEVLKSTKVSSKKIENTSFQFKYKTIEAAIKQLKKN